MEGEQFTRAMDTLQHLALVHEIMVNGHPSISVSNLILRM